MRRRRSVLLPLVPVAVTACLAACSGSGGSPARPTAAPSATRTGGPSWTARLDAVESPRTTDGGFAFQTATAAGTFQVVSVAAATGRVRWSAPTSPSVIAPGVSQETLVANGGRTVVYLAPAGAPSDGTVSVTAADAVTGRVVWSFGGGEYLTGSPPQVCHGGDQICLVGAPLSTQELAATALDARTGRVVATQPLPGGNDARELGPDRPGAGAQPDTVGLLDTVGSLTAVDHDGKVLWRRADSSVFGGQPVSPDDGWDVQEVGDRFVATLGDTRYAPKGSRAATAAQPASTAAFDVRTGRTRWVLPGASMLCGALSFDPAHPVLCTGGYTLDATDPTNPKVVAADISLEGVDLATGRARWTFHVGSVAGLVLAAGDVVQVDASHLTFRAGGRVGTVDLDRGVPVAVERAGWCPTTRFVATTFTAYGGDDPKHTYLATGVRPCTLDGPAPATVPSTPAFAGATSGGVFAWTDGSGTVHAVPAR